MIGADIPLTREMLFTMLYNIESITGKIQEADTSDIDITGFYDYEELSDWSVKAVKALVKSGRLKISGSDLLPKSYVDTGEIEAIVK
jgi:endo-1,4-beta-xylanase